MHRVTSPASPQRGLMLFDQGESAQGRGNRTNRPSVKLRARRALPSSPGRRANASLVARDGEQRVAGRIDGEVGLGAPPLSTTGPLAACAAASYGPSLEIGRAHV